ncbi:MAG: hypothetical protein ACJAZN_003654, partial [Planctomycetota bacterium]
MADGNSHSNEGQAANPAANPAAARHVEPAPEGAEFGAEYSKDYWDLVFEQLGKRMLFKVSMAVLTLLYGIAVFAPVI